MRLPTARIHARPMLRRCLQTGVWIIAVFVLAACWSYAESDRAIRGLVFEKSTGNPVAGAVLVVAGTMQSAQTDETGTFVLRGVPAGRVLIRVTRIGYRSAQAIPVAVREGFERVVRIGLVADPIAMPEQESIHPRQEAVSVRRFAVVSSDAAHAASVADLLEQVPGVAVYGSAESLGGTRISVGGAPPSRVAVLLDDLPLSGGADGAVDLSAIPVAAITAVEVRPGAQSAASGDAGIGGAVNLVTQGAAARNALTLNLNAGRYAARTGGMTWENGKGYSSWRLGIEQQSRGDRFSYPEGKSTLLRHNVSLARTDGFAEFHRSGADFNVISFWDQSRNGAPGPLDSRSPSAHTDNQHWRTQLRSRLYRHRRTSLFFAFWHERTREVYEKTEAIASHSRLVENFAGSRMTWNVAGAQWTGHTVWEIRYRDMQGEDLLRPRLSFGTHGRTTFELRQSFGLSQATSLGIVRADLQAALHTGADYPTALTPRADLSWRAAGHAWLPRVRFGWGRSYREPRLTSLFWKADAYASGNPDLAPEQAREWDLGLGWFMRSLTFDTRYFERSITDVIVWEKRGVPAAYQPVNLAAAWIYGREDFLKLQIGSPPRTVALAYSHTLTGSYDRTGDRQYHDSMLVFLPRHTHEVRLRGQWGGVTLTGEGRWVSRRFTLRAGTKWLAPYRVFAAGCRFRLPHGPPQTQVFLEIENITNEHYELLGRYPQPARAWRAGLQITFGPVNPD